MKNSFTKERREKISKSQKGIPKSAEHNLKNKIANTGKIRGTESNEKQSQSMKGKYSGEKNHKAKVNEKMVLQMRKIYDEYINLNHSNNGAIEFVKKQTGCLLSYTTLWQLLTRKSWKHLP